MTRDVLAFAAQKAAEGKRVALCTVTATSGSSPASPGQMMAVLSDCSSLGTVGGGASEHRLIKQAADAIKNGEAVFSFSFSHAEEGMTCGGEMKGFVSVVGGGINLAIFGGGHIAQSLAKIAALTGFSVTVIEDRPELQDSFGDMRYVVCNPEDYQKTDPAEGCSFAVVCTRGHATDAEALRYCLTRPLKYLGMIGSDKKAAEVLKLMAGEGFSKEALDCVYTPVGLDIAGRVPAEIAVAILSEILLVKNGGSLRHRRG